MHKIHKKLFGFTLIELLFVIAIIGVLASLGVSLMQKKAEEFKAKKAALQLQYILQAGMSYYVDKNEWPHPNLTINCTDLFCSKYIGPGIKKDPWGLDYYYWNNTSGPNITGKFFVNVKLPNKEIAQRVAGQLPYAEFCTTYYDQNCRATATDDTPWVRASVSVPGQAQQTAPVTIKKYGYVSVSKPKNERPADSLKCVGPFFARFQCPRGTVGQLFFSLSSYHHAGRVQGASPFFSEMDVGSAFPAYSPGKKTYCNRPDSQGNVNCFFKFCVQGNPKFKRATELSASALVSGVCLHSGTNFNF